MEKKLEVKSYFFKNLNRRPKIEILRKISKLLFLIILYYLSKKVTFKKKFFQEKLKTVGFYFKRKLDRGSDFTFQVPSRYEMYGTWPKKIAKVCDQNSNFHLQHPNAPRLDFESLKILQRTLFLTFCIILRSSGHYLPKLVT